MSHERTSVIWRILDGRPGHENQVIGLTEAIQRLRHVEVCDIRVNATNRCWREIFAGPSSVAASLPLPDLLIGAGHSTHVPMLVCSRRFGGRTVVIMKPSLPAALFDLCLIPEHDTLCYPTRNVVRTEGALNRVRPSARHDPGQGLILVGGPSKHFHWSDPDVIQQVCAVTSTREIRWTLATSERTPESFLRHVRVRLPDLQVVCAGDTSAEWLPRQLELVGTVWVTCDSMSMIYEALTAGAQVGLLELKPCAQGRIASNIQRLIRSSMVTSCSDWMLGCPLSAPMKSFSEADRCSRIVVDRCLVLSARHIPGFRLGDLLAASPPGELANPGLRGFAGMIPEVRLPLR